MVAGAEEPKRLEPTAETKRHLYLLSGNECAFPGCRRRLLNEHGDWVGEQVHIRGVKGERFDASMTNEQRRHRDNLLLMCHEHHVETNNEHIWTVQRLAEIKRQHESRYRRGLESYELRELPDALIDLTRAQTSRHASDLKRFADVLNLDLTTEELDGMVPELSRLVDDLAKLTPRARSMLGVVIDRGDPKTSAWGEEFHVPWPELRDILGVTDHELRELLDSLNRHGFVDYSTDEFEAPYPFVHTLPKLESGWPFWSDLKAYCGSVEGGVLVADVLTDLDFSLLDSET